MPKIQEERIMEKNKIDKGIIDIMLMRLEGSKIKAEFESALNRLEMYHSVIYQSEVRIALLSADRAQGAIDMEEFQYEVSRWDRKRRDVHNAAIGALQTINRICKTDGYIPAYNGPIDTDSQSRYIAGEAILAFVNEVVAARR
jgi:hypothetical protein